MNAKLEDHERSGTPSSAPAGQRIRVAQITGAMDFGGAENVIAHLATGLDPHRYAVTIVCTRGIGTLGERLKEQGVNVVLTRPYVRSRRHLGPLDLYRTLREIDAQVVHTHGEPPLSAAGPLGYLRLLPYWVHSFHYGNYPYAESKRMFLERTLCRPASALIAVADQQRATIIKHHRVAPSRIRTLLNGVQPNKYLDNAAFRSAKRRELGLRDEDLIVGTIAVLSKQKGVTYLLQGAREVLNAHPTVKFLIVGGGPLEAQLRREADDLRLGERVLFTGWRKDVQEILPTLDMFVMSSLWEAMPLTLLEAMAAHLPIVATNVGDNANLTGNGECAVIVPPADASALASAISRLIADSNAARAMAARAGRMFQERFTVRHMVAAHERLYEAAVAQRR